MRDLAEAGRAVVERPLAPPTPVGVIEQRARRQHRRRTRATVAFATAVVVLAGAVAIAVDRRPSSPVAPVNAHTPKRTAPVTASTLRLRAHLGVGVPKGWMPVDYRDARLWVPSNWAVTAGGCALPTAPGWIELGGPYKQACHTGDAARPFVSLTSASLDTTGSYKEVINSYPVLEEQGHGRRFDGWFSVPALHVLIQASGEATLRVVQTLAPSARVIALSAGAQPVPSTWRRISYAGISLAAPSSWPAQDVAGLYGPGCENLEPRHVWAGPPNLAAQCAVVITKPLPVDGVWIDHFAITTGDEEPSVTVRGDWGSRMEVRLISDLRQPAAPGELRLSVTVDEYTSELDIGLGPDGRVAKAILQSIRPSTGAGSGFTVGEPDAAS